MNGPPPDSVAGAIKAEPNPLPRIPGAVTRLSWETNAAAAEVYVSEDGAAEKLFSISKRGSREVNWIQPGRTYVFRLYETETHRLLDEVRVTKEIRGKLTCAPNPVPLEAGAKTLLTWEITEPATAEICVSENGMAEKLVCRGATGSHEITGLRGGIKYAFRLYNHAPGRQLLDEVFVELSDIPWRALRERWESSDVQKQFSNELAQFIAALLPACIRRPEYAEWFHLWEGHGVHVTPVHFYEPIPDSRTLSENLWQQPLALPGIDLNDESQHHFLVNVLPKFRDEYDQIPLEAGTEKHRFYLNNGRFGGLDALLAYGLVRHFRPQQIIEVGSGYSSLILALAAGANGTTQLHCVEPYPEDFLNNQVRGISSLLVQQVQSLGVEYFDRLQEGDFLFIDTSHVVRIGGDVNYLFLNVIPRLKAGVIIHVHDIFLPYEYPRDWVVEKRRFWTEQYLLQAFLAHNLDFEVLISSWYLKGRYPDELRELFPQSPPWEGGSFWMRRKPATT